MFFFFDQLPTSLLRSFTTLFESFLPSYLNDICPPLNLTRVACFFESFSISDFIFFLLASWSVLSAAARKVLWPAWVSNLMAVFLSTHLKPLCSRDSFIFPLAYSTRNALCMDAVWPCIFSCV